MKYYNWEVDYQDILIKNYEITGDVDTGSKIVVNFTDGGYYTIPLTDENEKNVIDKMIEQADECSNNRMHYEKKRKKNLDYIYRLVAMEIINTVLITASQDVALKIISGIAMGIAGIGIISAKVHYNLNTDELEDIKKYSIYLAMRETLEKNSDNPNLYNGLEFSPLTINTIDNFSLNDVKKVKSNLQKQKLFSKFYNKKEV